MLYLKKMFNIVLISPEIPHNTGAIGRLCLSTGATLHLVSPLGFKLTEKAVKRAGLDYWEHVDLVHWESIETFLKHLEREGKAFYLLTTKTEAPYWEASFKEGDYLLLGAETKGLPETLLRNHPEKCLTIPIDKTKVRSLNLATAAGIILFEGMRQLSES